MKSSLTRTELLAFWYWTENESVPSKLTSKPASASALALRSSRALHHTKSRMSGWSASSRTIFAARARLSAALDGAGGGVGAPHEAHRAARRAAAADVLAGRADPGQVHARSRAALEDPPLLRVPVQDRVDAVLDGQDEAGRDLRRHAGDAQVEPDRRVEGGALVQQEPGELGGERRRFLVVGEVAVGDAPAADRVHDPVDDLAQGGFPLGSPQAPPEVLLGDDVGRRGRPRGRELHAGLLEGDAAAVGVLDACDPLLPDHPVVGMDAPAREVPGETAHVLLGGQGHQCSTLLVDLVHPARVADRRSGVLVPFTDLVCRWERSNPNRWDTSTQREGGSGSPSPSSVEDARLVRCDQPLPTSPVSLSVPTCGPLGDSRPKSVNFVDGSVRNLP